MFKFFFLTLSVVVNTGVAVIAQRADSLSVQPGVPKNIYRDRVVQFSKPEKTPQEKEIAALEIINDLNLEAAGNDNEKKRDYLYLLVARGYSQENNYTKFEEYAFKISNKVTQGNELNSVARKLAEENENIDWATSMAKSAVDLMEIERNDSVNVTDERKKKLIDNLFYTNGDTYAFLLYRLGAYNDALAYQKNIVKQQQDPKPVMLEHYALYLEKTNDTIGALSVLDDAAKSNNLTPAMKTQLQQLYMTKHGEAAYDFYTAMIKKIYRKDITDECRKMILNEKAPNFTITDLFGKKVSLANYKGKVVVLDFWATWCGPCVHSFPAMQIAVNDYAKDTNVAFLFINTMEKDANAKQTIKNFIKEKQYTFNILLDDGKTVSTLYNVHAIPNKIVIDPNGIIRFRAMGEKGSEDQIVAKISAMIELAKGKN